MSAVVMHLWKLINTFYKKHLEKPIVTFPLFDSTPLMVRPTVPKE